MKKEYTSGASWNSASIAGLAMAAVTIALELVAGLCGKVPGVGGGFLGLLAWAVKLVICALTFRFLLKRFHASFADVDNSRLKKYGVKLALCSSLLVAAYSLVNILVINPDSINEIIQGAREGYASVLDSNSEAALEKMLPNMPAYIGVGTFVYCFIWGWLYSSVFSGGIAPDNPFADTQETIDNQ